MIHFDVYNERKHIIIGCIEEIEHIHHSSLGQDISWHHKEGGNDRQGMYTSTTQHRDLHSACYKDQYKIIKGRQLYARRARSEE